ncbi:MAG TPA: SusC/RagA family TonB-linked outer membrane protein [Longimicrobiaceae bacterium]|nr:SusC/RagA family TonB-linked outer membrane protein [Longimicrobiaceae bacterium]
MRLQSLVRSALVACLAFLPAVAAPLSAQGARVSGTVTDQQTGRPLSGVQVAVEGTSLVAVTGANGTYSIVGVPTGTHTLTARLLGYAFLRREGVRVADNAPAVINLALQPQALTLEEVVVTGVTDPTSITRVPFTVGKVRSEQLQVPAAGSPIAALQGKVAGVQVVRGSGQPGAAVSVQLRSPTSIQRSTAPLIVVDGVILGANAVDIESLDVESVEVLKGAAAAGIYGSRAGSGVIQIRTRRGRDLQQGKLRLNVRSEYGVNSLLRGVPLSGSHEFRMNANGEYVNAAGQVVTSRAQRTATETRFQDQPYPGTIYDPIEQFFDPGRFQNLSVSLAQNTERTNYYVSAVAAREGGVLLENQGLRRYDFRMNLDQRASDKLQLQFSAYHMRSQRDDLSGTPFFDLLLMPRDVNLMSRDSTGHYLYQPDPTAPLENPIWRQTSRDNNSRRERTTASAVGRFDATPWLTFDGDLAYDRSNRFQDQYVPKGTPFLSGTDPRGSVIDDQTSADAINAGVGATLRAALGDLSTRTHGRAAVERFKEYYFRAAGENFVTRGVPDLDQAQTRTVSSSFEEVRSNAYLINTNLDYAGKYIADFSIRREGSSLFGADQRWQTYYRASGAWRMAQEPWWPLAAIEEFKPRYSVGTAGGRPNYLDQYETYSVSSSGAITLGDKGNRDLRPERSREQEVGVDIVGLNGKVSLQLTYARVVTRDQIIQLPPKGATGFFSQWANGGTIQGDTYEASLELQLLQRDNLSWNVGLIADRSRHEITEWNRSCFVTGVTYRCRGETTGLYYGRRFLRGLDELPANLAASRDQFAVNDDGYVVWVGSGGSPTGGLNRNQAGQLLWNTSGVVGGRTLRWGHPIVQLDSLGAPALVKVGDALPDFHVGLTNSFRIGGLSVFGVLDSQVGADIYNSTRQRMYQYFRHADVDQAGKPDELKKPIDYYFTLYNGNNVTEHFVEDGTYLKLRELSVRYDLDPRRFRFLGSVGAERASIGLIGRNLLTWTSFTGYDPEVGNTTLLEDDFLYPNFRTVTALVEFSF